MSSLRKLIREQVGNLFVICEIKIAIDDLKNRGFADQIGKMFEDAFADLKPISISGKLGIKTQLGHGTDSSEFTIKLANGDEVYVFRNTNPAYATVSINGGEPIMIGSKEMFSHKLPDLARKYYEETINVEKIKRPE